MSAKARNEEQRFAGTRCSGVNVGETERQISMWGGTVLAAYGLLKGSLSGLTLTALGAALLYRGHTGHCHMYEALGYSTADGEQVRRGRHSYAEV
jgi:uncharacterized membrane protein